MSFEFRDSNNNVLTSSSVKQILSDLSSNGEVVLNVYTTEATNQPGIYLTPSTNLGELDYPGLNSPHTDYSDLLLMGSNTNNSSGLKVVKIENQIESEERFSFLQGSSYTNKILLPQLFDLPANSNVSIKLIFEKDLSIAARRFYVGVNVDDS
jgi:hypothetical protein